MPIGGGNITVCPICGGIIIDLPIVGGNITVCLFGGGSVIVFYIDGGGLPVGGETIIEIPK